MLVSTFQEKENHIKLQHFLKQSSTSRQFFGGTHTFRGLPNKTEYLSDVEWQTIKPRNGVFVSVCGMRRV